MKRHGLSVWRLLEKKSFRLAERDLPDLCADRIDYFFRDCVTDKQLDLLLARRMMDDMIVFDGDVAFQDRDLAKKFAITYREANEKLWANPLQSGLYYLLASAMKVSLEEAIISFDDLFTTDKEVYEKMKKSGHAEVLKYLHDMEHLEVREDDKDYDYHILSKIRVVDPYVLVDTEGKTEKHRISELEPALAESNARFLEKASRGHYVKVIS